MNHYILNFAQAYGSGTYGDSTYSCTAQQQAAGTCTVATTTGGGTGTDGSGGGLADTGIAMITLVTLACLFIFVAFVIRVWRRRPATQEVTVENPSEPSTGETTDRQA